MDKRFSRNSSSEKENDYYTLNKKSICSRSKIEQILLVKPCFDKELLLEKVQKQVKNPQNVNIKPSSKKETKSQSQVYCDDYWNTASMANLHAPLGNFLSTHQIDRNLRARMLDWMVEVTSSYKFTPKTYFASINIMDRYFKVEDQKISISKLHLVGVISMLMATKMDELYPLKIKTVYEKIVHRKISKKDIIQMEGTMANKLDYDLNCWTFYDLAVMNLYMTDFGITVKQKEDVEVRCEYVSKFVVFDYQLYCELDQKQLAEVVLHIAIDSYNFTKAKKIFEQSNQINNQLKESIKNSLKQFKKSFKSLQNIFKYGKKEILENLEKYINY